MARKKSIYAELPDLDRKLFRSKLETAFLKSNDAYYKAVAIIREVENEGGFDHIKHFADAYAKKKDDGEKVGQGDH